MARLTGPDDRYRYRPGTHATSGAGSWVTYYAGPTGTTLADIRTTGGAVIAGSRVQVSASWLLPEFLFPDGVNTIYEQADGSTDRYPVHAGTDARLDALEALPPGGGGGVTDHGLLTGLADNDHPQFALGTALTAHTDAAAPHTGHAASGHLHAGTYATLVAGTVPDNQIPSGIARDSEVTGAVDAEATARINADALLIPLTQKAAAGGVATLGADSKIPTSQLPALAQVDTFPVASQAAMLALTAQRGDLAIRSDLNKTFSLSADDPTVLANWLEHATPTDAVLSVNGTTGVVSVTPASIGALPATDPSVTNARTPTAHTLNGALHTASGLTAGHVLRALTATTFDFAAITDADLPGTIARDSEVATAVANHEADTTAVHGIANTALLALASQWDAEAIIRVGNATVANNVMPPGIRVPRATTLTAAHLRAGTAPVGATLTVLVRRSGVTLATLTLATTVASSSVTGLSVALAAGDVLTFDVTGVGSVEFGADLAVALVGI